MIKSILLAAGKASRMGQPKQLLEAHGMYLFEWPLRAISAIDPSPIVVTGAYHTEMEQALSQYPSIQICRNPDWALGLSSSLIAGLKYAQKTSELSAIQVILADQPFVTTKHLQHLIDIHQAHPDQLIAYKNGSRMSPPAIIPQSFFSAVLEINGDRGAGSLFKKHPESVNLIDAPELLQDIDTPEDFETFLKAQ